jgi:hypothetical protein
MPLKFKSTGLSVALDAKLKALSTQGFIQAKAAVASTLRDLIAEGFQKKVAPGGQAWKPRKDSLPHPLLDKSGAMKRGFEIDTYGPRLVIKNEAVSEQGRPYPWFHQTGTSKMPARKVVPDRTLSSRWKSQVNKTIAKALERLS